MEQLRSAGQTQACEKIQAEYSPPNELGWNPFTGARVFKSANAAWEFYGKYRFACAKRTFLQYVGKQLDVRPASDGLYHVEDIELFAKSKAWPPAPSFALPPLAERGAGANAEEIHYGALFQKEKALKEAALREREELDLAREKGEVLPMVEYEQRLAAAATVVAVAAENFAHESAREIIHICEGNPMKEEVLREWLMEQMREWLDSFSKPVEYELDFIE